MSGAFLAGLAVGTIGGVVAGAALTLGGLYFVSWAMSGRAWPWAGRKP